MIHRCPLLIDRDGKPVVLGHGYHRELGGRYVTGDIKVTLMPLKEAVENLLARRGGLGAPHCPTRRA